MIDWLRFFEDSIAVIHDQLAAILGASGCREGWLQGELFRAGHQYHLRVNEYSLGYRQKTDLSCSAKPAMIAEIKIVGADYSPKMEQAIEADVKRLRQVNAADTERYMILIIPKCNEKNKLGYYLDTCSFSSTCFERDFPAFRLRIWRL